MQINIVSNFFGTSGFAAHTRQFANALHDAGMEVRVESPKPQGWELQVNDAELLMHTREFSEDYISVLIGQPQYIPLVKGNNPVKTIAYVIWEGTKTPKYWNKHLLLADQVWVPSKHVKTALKNGGFKGKVIVIPEGVDNVLFQQAPKTERPFTFLSNKGWAGGLEDRGGLQYSIKAYLEEFTSKEKVRYIVKVNPAYGIPDIAKLVELLGIKNKDLPNIMYNTDEVPYNYLPRFYATGDVFVNSCRAEGFGLPGLEAHAMGLPTIQTDFGGQLDYMGDDMYINYRLDNVAHDLLYEETQWATPKIKHLQNIMRWAYNNQDKINIMGVKARDSVKEWTWAKAASKAIKELRGLK